MNQYYSHSNQLANFTTTKLLASFIKGFHNNSIKKTQIQASKLLNFSYLKNGKTFDKKV